MDGRARDWLSAGSFFEWMADAASQEPLRIFHAEFGDPAADALLLVHGFPTSSIDWFDVVDALAREHRVCVLDFPGFGFSDKPRHGSYSIERDRDLLEHYLAAILGLESATLVAHDRGDSVALALAAHSESGAGAIEVRNVVLSNGNVFLPLSNLTAFQRLLLHEQTASPILNELTAEMLAAGMGASTFSPPRDATDPAIRALAQTFAYNNGIAVLHETIQYLVERSENELGWLQTLARSSIPTALVWGLRDTVAPPRVAFHVWERHLATKPGANEFWLLPGANHYLQHDEPDQFAEVVLRVIDGRPDSEPGPISPTPGAAVLVDRSRSELPSAAAVLAADASLEDLRPAPETG